MAGSRIQCPSCRTTLRSSAQIMPGSSIRCTKCDVVILCKAKEADPEPVDWEPDADASRPRRPETKARPTRQRPRDDDEEMQPQRRPWQDDQEKQMAPRRRPAGKQKRSRRGLIIGLSIAGGVVVLLAVAGFIIVPYWLSTFDLRASTTSVAPTAGSPPPWTPPPVNPPTPAPPEGDPPQQAADGPVVIDPAQVFNPSPVVNPPPIGDPNPPAPPPSGNGVLADDVLNKIKKATVFIRVTSGEGVGSGSGFFEATSGLVLTNAHVVSMLHAQDPPPKKIEVVLRSGEKDEKTLEARIAAVDRVSDLAVLSVDVRAAGLAKPPASLTVASAAGLRETHQVYVAGFPLGENLGKDITVRTSSVASLRKDKDGVLAQVQINGGIDPGNSGGPVVDAGGNVVGVSVAKIRGTEIDFAIPGDTVQAVFRGRCSEIRAGETFRKGDQIAVPVDVATIDPTHSLHSVAVDWWFGDPKDAVAPSNTPPASPAAPTRRTTPTAYQPDAMTGHADILLPSLPPPGKVLWVQANFVDAAGQTRWVSGLPIPVEQPVEAKPAVLALRPPTDKMRLTLKSTATLKLRTADGETHSLVNNIEARMLEEPRGVNPDGLTTLYETFQHFAIGRLVDGKDPPPSPRLQAIVGDVRTLGLTVVMDSQGNMTQKQTDMWRVPPPSREALALMGDQLLQSLDMTTVPVPGGLAQPGQSWKASRNVPVDTINTYLTATAQMTYTYRGVRSVNGQDYGIVALHGVIQPLPGQASNLTGQVNGMAAIDLTAGRLYQVHAVVDMNVDVRFADESLRSNDKLDVNVTRNTP